jgi:hypothetical protein
MQYANPHLLLALKHPRFWQTWQYHHQTEAKYRLDVKPSRHNGHHQLSVLYELLLQLIHNSLYQGPIHEVYKAIHHAFCPRWLSTIFYTLHLLIFLLFFPHLSPFQPFLPLPHLFSYLLIVHDRLLHEVSNQIHDHDQVIFLNHLNKNCIDQKLLGTSLNEEFLLFLLSYHQQLILFSNKI